MVRVPDAEVGRLKAEVPLAETAGMALRKTGSDFTGCCPFHDPQERRDRSGAAP